MPARRLPARAEAICRGRGGEGIVGRYIGEAPRVGLAAVYENTGRLDQAVALWTEIRHRYRRASSAWRRTEKQWYRLATAKLDAQKR